MAIKKNKTFRVSILLLLITVALGMTYVGSRLKNAAPKEEKTMLTGEKQFVCSMHPEVIKDEPGDCPICGMSLIEKIDQSTLVKKKQFVCSMHPEVIKDEPGDCPICGMSLIEKIGMDKSSADSLLTDVVQPVNESVLGSVTTVNPFEADLPVIIEAPGIINYDSRKIRTISARFGGVVERSFIKYQFQPVRKGQKIYEIYCPAIYTEKLNYLKLIQMYPDQDNLTVEAREWLNLLGLTKGQIDSLKRAVKPNYHLPVYSDADGYAVDTDFDPEKYFSGAPQSNGNSLGFNDGVTIETGTPLFKVIDVNSLRADLKVRTEDAWQLRKGQKVIFTPAASPEQKTEAAISQVEPLNGGLFQLVKVYFSHNEGHLLPGSQIQARITAGNHKALWLSKTAVVNLGQHQSVFVMRSGKFIAVAVKTGLRSGDNIEILSGVDSDSNIALNALLLTDSDGFINTVSR
jgi:Cu(I)/Ag(I) efflux system membrane fusion protein